MKIAILAADQVKKWDRHTRKINEESTVERTIRQLKERGFEDVWVTHPPEVGVRYASKENPKTMRVVNFETGNDLGCIYGIKDSNFDLFLFGDVYFSDAAIDLILKEKTNFYARTKAGEVKHYGEMFAMRPDENFWKVLDRMWDEYKIKKTRKRLWSWDLYSEIMGRDFYKFRNMGNMTEISDETEDFDKPEEMVTWVEKHSKKLQKEGKVVAEKLEKAKAEREQKVEKMKEEKDQKRK